MSINVLLCSSFLIYMLVTSLNLSNICWLLSEISTLLHITINLKTDKVLFICVWLLFTFVILSPVILHFVFCYSHSFMFLKFAKLFLMVVLWICTFSRTFISKVLCTFLKFILLFCYSPLNTLSKISIWLFYIYPPHLTFLKST